MDAGLGDSAQIISGIAMAKTMMKLYDALEDNDDVQKVYANFDIDEKILAAVG